MYLVKDRRLGKDNYVFTYEDPRTDGFAGDVVDGVKLDYDMNTIHHWDYGQHRPNPRLGRDIENPRHYKVFKFPDELQKAGFDSVSANLPFVTYSWADYRTHYYPVPEEYAKSMTQEEWFDLLEELDSAAKIRKHLNKSNLPPKGSTRDQVAEWVAKQHMVADKSIRQVWYLPNGAPGNEIRLLEINDQYTGETEKVEPLDFGFDIQGEKYKLFVADISELLLQKIKADPESSLPNGWKIDGALHWGRRQ